MAAANRTTRLAAATKACGAALPVVELLLLHLHPLVILQRDNGQKDESQLLLQSGPASNRVFLVDCDGAFVVIRVVLQLKPIIIIIVVVVVAVLLLFG